MSFHYSPKIVTDGLVLALDPANLEKLGVSPYNNLAGDGSITNSNFATTESIFRSNCVNSATGTSEFTFSGMEINTGSVTVQWFMNVTSNPNVDGNNNWRRLIAQTGGGRSPFGFVLEQSMYINFTLQTTTGNKRYLNSSFTPYNTSLNTWQMHTFTYNKSTGTSACYRNDTLQHSGVQTTNGSGANATVAGEAMVNLSTSEVMGISNSNSSSGGDACLPADLGYWLIYDKALTLTEVQQNYNALKTRYGL
jgi:hypothetical protein